MESECVWQSYWARNTTTKDSFIIIEVPQWVISNYLKWLQSFSNIWQISDSASILMPPFFKGKGGEREAEREREDVQVLPWKAASEIETCVTSAAYKTLIPTYCLKTMLCASQLHMPQATGETSLLNVWQC